MRDDPQTEIEQVAAEFIPSGWVAQEEICTQLGIGEETLEVCVEWKVIDAPTVTPEGRAVFSPEMIDRLCQGLRLHRDLGLNWPGVGVALDLLERIEELEHRIRELAGE